MLHVFKPSASKLGVIII